MEGHQAHNGLDSLVLPPANAQSQYHIIEQSVPAINSFLPSAHNEQHYLYCSSNTRLLATSWATMHNIVHEHVTVATKIL